VYDERRLILDTFGWIKSTETRKVEVFCGTKHLRG